MTRRRYELTDQEWSIMSRSCRTSRVACLGLMISACLTASNYSDLYDLWNGITVLKPANGGTKSHTKVTKNHPRHPILAEICGQSNVLRGRPLRNRNRYINAEKLPRAPSTPRPSVLHV